MQCSFPSTGIIPFNSTSGLTHSLMLQEINVSTDPAQMVCHAVTDYLSSSCLQCISCLSALLFGGVLM